MEEFFRSTEMLQYAEILDLIKDLPDYQRVPAENRFLLIKEYEDFLKAESERLGKRVRKAEVLRYFCDVNGINQKTFYRYLKLYRSGGIKALATGYGKRKGKGKYVESILPVIRQIIKPGKGYKPTFDELVATCGQRGMEAPSYHTFWRMVIASGLSDTLCKPKAARSESVESAVVEKRDKSSESCGHFKIEAPDLIRVVDKRSFNVAMYKYGLVLPFLNPDLDRKEKNRLIEEIINRKHQPQPGATIKISRASFYRYIAAVKEKGFDGLIPKYCFRVVRRCKNIVRATLEIEMKDPLACLHQLREIFERYLPSSLKTKASTVRFLDRCLADANTRAYKYKQLFLDPPLTDEEIHKLEDYKAGHHKRYRGKAVATLMANANYTMLEIVTAVNRPYKTIHRWIHKFKKDRMDSIETRIDRTKNNPELRERKSRIIKILHCQPKDYDINRTSWRLEDIARIYEKEYGKKLSTTSIRRNIKGTGYSIKRAIRVLTSNDPKYREKTKKVLDTLRNLGPNDAFFFIDEAGPWQVKKYGGKSLTPKGTIKTYPQFQIPKGRVTFIAALDAIKNQVAWLFAKSKDTSAVISLIKILFEKYHGYSTLYLTWDCASWHRSKELQKFLNKLNSDKEGPTVEVVPLPKQSQFLNVIESVFSGMKGAVIFNSDYNSEDEMKAAISRHFEERNEYFTANPKRVGKKIWDEEYYNLDEFESGLFKKM